MSYAKDFGPWKRVLVRPTNKCHKCGEPLPSGVTAFVCLRTGAWLCGACGVRVLSNVFNLKSGGVKT